MHQYEQNFFHEEDNIEEGSDRNDSDADDRI